MHKITVQRITNNGFVPKNSILRKWAKQALDKKIDSAEAEVKVYNDGSVDYNFTAELKEDNSPQLVGLNIR